MVGDVTLTPHTPNFFSSVLDYLKKMTLWGVGGLFPPVPPVAPPLCAAVTHRSCDSKSSSSMLTCGCSPSYANYVYKIETDRYIGRYLTANIGIGFKKWYRSDSSTKCWFLFQNNLFNTKFQLKRQKNQIYELFKL